MRAIGFAVAVAVVGAAGCYNPAIVNGQFSCGANGPCPVGFTCACGQCVANGSSAMCDMGVGSDGGNRGDMSMMTPLGGCSNGTGRVTTDPGVLRVAACPAAWLVPGLTTTAGRSTPCNRRPGMNGTNGVVQCSAEDNCAPGWHVCNGEMELHDRGFERRECDALAQPHFFATRQAGAPPMPPATGMPACGTPQMPRTIHGCGGQGSIPDFSWCAITNKVLVDDPMNLTDECSSQTSGAFLCIGVNMQNGEIAVVTKPSLMGGGVLCCLD